MSHYEVTTVTWTTVHVICVHHLPLPPPLSLYRAMKLRREGKHTNGLSKARYKAAPTAALRTGK